jgi:hypothetical protein
MTENLGSALGAREAPGPWRIGITTAVLVAVVSIYVAVTAPRIETPPAAKNAATDALRGGCERHTEPRGAVGRATAWWPARPLRCVEDERLRARALLTRTPR